MSATLVDAEFYGPPSYGNSVLPEKPDEVLLSGRFHRVPVLSGITRDEGTFFAALWPRCRFPTTSTGRTWRTCSGVVAEVERRYPLPAYRSARHALAAVVSDREWAWLAQDSDELFARHVPSYSFEFTDRRAAPLFEYPADSPPGASHGADLGYLFDRLGRPNRLDHAQRALADRMIRHWGRFARAADPNGAGLTRWLRYRHTDAVPYVQELGPDRAGPYDRSGQHQLRFSIDLG